jgi:hypothetical protein
MVGVVYVNPKTIFDTLPLVHCVLYSDFLVIAGPWVLGPGEN